MDNETLKEAIALAAKIGHVFVATADAHGLPHVAAARSLGAGGPGHVLASAWFCPGTVENLQANTNISVVVWNPLTDQGYQLLGQVERVRDAEVLDGYQPSLEGKQLIPQVSRQLLMRVDRILEFSLAPHTDLE